MVAQHEADYGQCVNLQQSARCMRRLMTVVSFAFALPALADEPPTVSVSFGFEPRIGTFAQLDAQLRAYDFAPVTSVLMPTWGLRGRAFLGQGFFAALTMTAGFRATPGPGIPTTLSVSETTGGVGYVLPWGLFGSVEVGFSALTQSVGSTREGGALVYLGPIVQPRVGWLRQFFAPFGWFIAVSVGASVHFPVGPAHTNPLWEERFQRTTISAFTVTVESGLGYRSPR